jgi:adenosine kinase
LTPYCDIIIGNETEAASWAESHNLPKDTSITAIAKAIATQPKKNTGRARTVIITQGLEPSIVAVARAGAKEEEVEISEYPVHAIEKEKINDTNGAGDAFAGGFMAGVVLGKELKESMHMGQWLARLSIQELGPSYPWPKQEYRGYS